MKIYTKTGDKGQTSLLGGVRVGKSSARIELIGAIDELNSLLGLVVAMAAEPTSEMVLRTQRQLFALGAELARPAPGTAAFDQRATAWTEQLEREIDRHEETLPPLVHFILPGGTAAAASIHLARAVCRRVERTFFSEPSQQREPIGIYLNRLGDWLFVLARLVNQSQGGPETIWKAGDE